ncbi:MAG: hypothetical protein JW795_14635, partial [Chitinivibrionales bacterium]|nr:hypothetical protein [Chitinivibrionales bacterium]
CFAFDDIDASYRYSLHAWNASLSEVCFLETLPQERNENGFNVVLTLARPGAVAIMLPLETAVRDELYFIRNTLITSRQRTTITTLSDHHEVCIGGVAPGYFQGVASLKNENSADRSQPLSGPITITAGDTVQVGWYMRQWTYTSRNSGLPTDKVLVIAQDETGSKWFLTEKNSAGRISRKLCHFDDAAWYMHTTSNGEIPQINTMSFDSDNTLWCGTQQNILKVKQPTQIMAFLSFQTAYTPIVDVTAIRFPRDSGAWIATNGFGAAFVTDGQTVSYTNVNSGLPSNFITACGVDDNNNAWFATSAGAACLTAAGVWNVYTQTNSGLPSDDLTGLCVTEDNTVWVGAGQAGAAFFDGNTWHSYQSNNSLLNGNRIVSMVVDTAQTVWFGLDCGAVVTFNGSVWKRYDHTNSKMVPPDKSGAVVSMFVDEGDNSVWVAMQNSGIVVFKEWKKW